MRALFVLWIMMPTVSWAFPEMIRHGYVNCTSCHVSPSGGGLLTTYGRSISKEFLSRWSAEGEENLLHGAIKKQEVIDWINGSRDVGFNIGGDVRYIQLYRNSKTAEQGRFFPMQRDLEAAVKLKDLTLVGQYGIEYNATGKDEFESRRVYAIYQVLESLSLRVGRYLPIYGIMISDHYLAIKRNLGFDQGFERDNLELNYINENWSGTLAMSRSPKSLALNQQEKAFTAQINYAFSDTYRLGFNYWKGDFETRQRSVFGVNALLGFTPEWYLLSEIDYQVSDVNGTGQGQKGVFYYQKLGYEFTRGVHALAQIDGGQSDLDIGVTKTFAYGLGVNFYPRPHFEVQGLWNRTRIKAVSNDEMDMAHLILHYYF